MNVKKYLYHEILCFEALNQRMFSFMSKKDNSLKMYKNTNSYLPRAILLNPAYTASFTNFA